MKPKPIRGARNKKCPLNGAKPKSKRTGPRVRY